MIALFLLFGGAVCGWVLNDRLTRRFIVRYGFDAYRETKLTDYL